VEAVSRLPRAVAALVDGGVAAVHVGHVIGATIDVLTGRLLDLAIEEAGPPPTEWAWLAFGSLGRREQALQTDQDHGLAYGDERGDPDRVDAYFARLAESVTDGLELAGLPRCKGHIMAVNPRMRRTLHGWVEAFTGWIVGEEDLFAGAASIVFDFRRVAGTLDVEPTLDRVVRAARSAEGFTRRLTRHALENKPPTGLFRDFRVEGSGDHAGRFDLKHGGIVPVTDLARLHAVAAGVAAHRTLDRLRLARDAGQIDDEMCEGLGEAFRLFWQIRLDHQISCIRAGRTPDDFVDPHELSPLRRQALREAFRIVVRAQRVLGADAMLPPP
jgi:CBS domain-containing protein